MGIQYTLNLNYNCKNSENKSLKETKKQRIIWSAVDNEHAFIKPFFQKISLCEDR